MNIRDQNKKKIKSLGDSTTWNKNQHPLPPTHCLFNIAITATFMWKYIYRHNRLNIFYVYTHTIYTKNS